MATLLTSQQFEPLALAKGAEAGVSAKEASKLADHFAIPTAQFATVIGLSERTLQRRFKDGKPLTTDDGAKILRVQRLIAIADEVFENPIASKGWFLRPLRVLGGRSPLSLCATEFGAREVEDTLGRIDHGVFS